MRFRDGTLRQKTLFAVLVGVYLFGLVLNAADKMDRQGNKAARQEIAMIKVAAPQMLNFVVDWAIQAHGAAGMSGDFGLGHIAASARTMRIVDGPDEVHRNQIGKMEFAKY